MRIPQAIPICILLAAILPEPSFGENTRFRVIGDTLFFNGDIPREESGDHIDMEGSDASEFGAYIMEQPEITTIDLRSDGGSLEAGVRRRMIWNSLVDFVADGLGSSDSRYAAWR